MKPEYDFSQAERGKFYRAGAELRLPLSLDHPLQERLDRIAPEVESKPGPVVPGQVREKDS